MNYTWNWFPIHGIQQIWPSSDYYLFADIKIIEIYVITETDKLLYEKSIEMLNKRWNNYDHS